MSKKTEDFYFNNFVECAKYACDASALLEETIRNFDPETFPAKMAELHAIEQEGDRKKHEMFSNLVRAFITPIERDDIMKLCQTIDDVTDSVEDIVLHMYMNNVMALRKDSLQFAEVINKICLAMKEMLIEFKNFKKSKTLNDLIIEINHLEEVGDKLYHDSMRKLHVESKDPMEVLAWRDIYFYFEKCCDACEDVADIIEGIVVGNS